MKAYVAETLCSQLLMIKIAVYLFAQDQIASYCINVCLSKYILHVYYVYNPVAEGVTQCRAWGMALCRYFKSYSRSISFTAATQRSICHYSPACTYAYIMEKHCVHVQYVDKMYVHKMPAQC